MDNGHVHIGTTPLDTARQRWKRLFKVISGFEDVIYRLAGSTEGRIRSGYRIYTIPFADSAARAAAANFSLESADDVNRLARDTSGGNRFNGINLTNIYKENRPRTVEFRYFNSSLDPKQLQANVKIANAVMVAAEKARTKDSADGNTVVTDTIKKRGNLLKGYSRARHDRSNSTVAKFVDILFSRKKDKNEILSVFSRNRWAN